MSDEEPEEISDYAVDDVDDWETEERKCMIGVQRKELLEAIYEAAGARIAIDTPDFWQYRFPNDDDSAYWEITAKHRPFFEYTRAKRLAISEEWKQLREHEFEDVLEKIGNLAERLRHIRALEDVLIKKLLNPLSEWDTEPVEDDWDEVPMAPVARPLA